MGIEQETAVRSFLAETEGEKWDSARIERVLSHMAPDARYQVFAWEEPFVGHDAIRADLHRQGQLFRDLQVVIVTIGSVGQLVFTERQDSMTINGTAVTFHTAGVFEVDDAGKIAAWRDYLDSKEVETKVGAGVSSAGTRPADR